MINHLGLRNFKGFENESIELRPITLLLGPNNSGKSAAISSIKLLAQTLESYDRTVPLLLNGKYGDFGTYKDLVFKNNPSRQMHLSIESKKSFSGKNQSEEQIADSRLSLKYKFKSQAKQIVLDIVDISLGGKNRASFKYSDEKESLLLTSLLGENLHASQIASINEPSFFHFLPNSIWVNKVEQSNKKNQSQRKLTEEQIKVVEEFHVSLRSIYTSLSQMDYLSALRLPPARTYAYSGEKHAKVGAAGENAMSIFAMDTLRKDQKSKSLNSQVVSWLSKAGIASEIAIQDLAGRFFELQIKHPSTGVAQNIADVGFGVSQVLPVLVGGFNARKNSTYIVEEPEIHLHPKAQAELGAFFYSLYKNSVQSIIETHSEHLILRLLQYVAKGEIPSKDIVIYAVTTSDKGCNLTKIEIDSSGTFVGTWPTGFFPERLDEARKLALARSGN